MQMKLDENLGQRGRQLFVQAGHDVSTVADEGLAGAEDDDLIEACKAGRRVLVTLDLDFSNPFLFPPEEHVGVAVIRLPRRPTPSDLFGAVSTLIARLEEASIEG
jgi:predicted nuclease of predicted toxin-antitoxin system